MHAHLLGHRIRDLPNRSHPRQQRRCKVSTPKQIHVLFHRDHDGVASAYPLWFIFGAAADYHSVQYGEPFPILPDESRVFIVDFSWPEKDGMTDALIQFVSHHREVKIIDHHTGPAEESLREVAAYWEIKEPMDGRHPRFTYVFDKTKAGTELAWQFAQDYSDHALQGPPPRILQLIADRDLWRHKNDPAYSPEQSLECERLHQGLSKLAEETGAKWGSAAFFGLLHAAIRQPDTYAKIIRDGTVALATANAAICAICKNAYLAPVSVETDGKCDTLRIPTVESAVWQSEIAHELLARNPDAPAAIVRYTKPAADGNGTVTIHSVRSRAGDDTAQRIAIANGGGGHPQAAGFTTHTPAQ
jgi:hypothetical protein